MSWIAWILLGFIAGYIVKDALIAPDVKQVYSYVVKRLKPRGNGKINISQPDTIPSEKDIMKGMVEQDRKGLIKRIKEKRFKRKNK